MLRLAILKSTIRPALLLVVLNAASLALPLQTQSTDSPEAMKQRIAELVKQENYTDALPLLEKMVVTEPDNHEMHFYLAFALLARGNSIPSAAEKKALRLRSRAEFIKAKELGDNHPIIDALIQSISTEGLEDAPFSANKQADALMTQAEAFFSQGKLDAALETYQKALLLDPKLYDAAVFSGDVYTHNGNWAQAEVWYQKAIAIDPIKEKAYRYSATPLMKQGKYDIARDRYVEAYIAEPYSKFSQAGLSQWGNVTKTPLGHPKIDIPTNVKFDEKGDAQINLSMNALLGGKDDGSFAWIIYGGTRSLWHKEKFAKTFPDEKAYRHSLKEEADALRGVISLATSEKNTKQLSPSLAKLKELDSKSLLEAYILLAIPDAGIAVDYANYRQQNRDKLRRYVVEYVLTNGGK